MDFLLQATRLRAVPVLVGPVLVGPVLVGPVLVGVSPIVQRAFLTALLSAPGADTEDLELMPGRLESMGPADLHLEGRDARGDELDHPAALGAHQVVVVLPRVDVLVEIASAAQTVAAHQTAFDQQIEVPVDGGAGDLDLSLLERLQKLLGVDVAVLGEDLVEQSQPLGGHAVTVVPEVVEKLFPFLVESHVDPPRLACRSPNSLLRLSLT